MALDRPDDIGDKFPSDLGDAAPANPITDRELLNYAVGFRDKGVATSGRSQFTKTDAASTVGRVMRVEFVFEAAETLSVRMDGEPGLVVVAKPPTLITRQPFSDKDDEVVFASEGTFKHHYLDNNTRISALGASPDVGLFFEKKSPPYAPGDILYAIEVENTTTVNGIKWLDLNVDGRCWVPERAVRAGIVEEIAGDYLRVRITTRYNIVDRLQNKITIAKPFNLRRSPFEKEQITYPGYDAVVEEKRITYVYQGPQKRIAFKRNADPEEEETQIIIPSYKIGEEIYFATIPDGAASITGADGIKVSDVRTSIPEYIDLNVAARAWARKFEEE